MPSANIWSVDVHMFNNVGGKKGAFSPKEHVCWCSEGSLMPFYRAWTTTKTWFGSKFFGRMERCLFVLLPKVKIPKRGFRRFGREMSSVFSFRLEKRLYSTSAGLPHSRRVTGRIMMCCSVRGGQSACQLGAGTPKLFLATYTKQWLVISLTNPFLYELRRQNCTAEGYSFVSSLENHFSDFSELFKGGGGYNPLKEAAQRQPFSTMRCWVLICFW